MLIGHFKASEPFKMIFMDVITHFPFPIPHSCYPTCGVNGANQVVLIRGIEPGELLTVDYSTLFSGSEPIINCSCGHVGCRGKIRGFNFLPVLIQDFYLLNNAVCRDVLVSLNLNSVKCDF